MGRRLCWGAAKVLGIRSGLFQAAMQPLAGWLSGCMEGIFREHVDDWNGRPSCLLLSFDCDFPEDALALPRVAEALENKGLRSTFACVGRWVEDYPEAHRPLVEYGHELMNHSYSHPELVNSPRHFVSARDDFNPRSWNRLSVAEQREEIVGCQRAVEDRLGVGMTGFRVPHFGNVDLHSLYGMLAEVGLRYSSSMLASRGPLWGVPVWRSGVLEIPVTTCPRHPYASLDSWHAFHARGGWHRHDFGELLRRRLERGIEKGLLTNIYLDPKDRERLDFPALFAVFASYRSDCWMPTYEEFRQWWAAGRASPDRTPAGKS